MVEVNLDEYLTSLAGKAPQEKVVAYFDLDKTLISGYSLTALAWQQIYNLEMSPRRFCKMGLMFASYGLGRIDYTEMLAATIEDIRGMPETKLVELGEQAFERWISTWVYKQGLQLLDAHRALGHELVLVTSATKYQATPLTKLFKIDSVYQTELVIEGGVVAGGVAPCYGEGKLTAAQSHAEISEVNLDNSYFYSDSYDDLPLLAAVGYPVVVNAGKKLSRQASKQEWPQLRFTH